ncbi:MAG: hypothetical protein J6K32_11690 [Clostridia bacterium]|nr:hypothetical protein [Clostridia bacterium]
MKKWIARLGMMLFVLTVCASSAAADVTAADLRSVYDQYCDAAWADLSSDGTSLSLDTNPNNTDDYTNFSAYLAIEPVNKALGLPGSVFTRMGSTTSMQGVQTATAGNLTVSWSYHPDNGMEIIYFID